MRKTHWFFNQLKKSDYTYKKSLDSLTCHIMLGRYMLFLKRSYKQTPYTVAVCYRIDLAEEKLLWSYSNKNSESFYCFILEACKALCKEIN